MKQSILHIGFDDTDSRNGMCTTFLAYKIVENLRREKVQFLDYPYLIRFNPNIPWKTRGNGAVALKVVTRNPKMVKRRIISFVKKYSAIGDGANPGLVFYESDRIPEKFSKFGRMALHTLVNRGEAKKFAAQNNIETFYMGNGQGLVGAIGAIGYDFDDHTFELISYRRRSNFGRKREIAKDSVRIMQEATFPRTFNSYDGAKRRILIAPHGPDPVLFGVRGEDLSSVVRGASLVRSKEKYSGYMVFRSNQGTGTHLQNELDIADLRPYSSGYVVGQVSTTPRIEIGGHVMFTISNSGKTADCAVYRPTGLANVAANLIKGDMIKIGGGVRKASKRYGRTLNVEFIDVIKLAKNTVLVNPMCTKCAKRMKSKGRGQGFKCVKCGRVSDGKTSEEVPRKIKEQLYLPIVSAHRHLTRPMQRISRFNKKIVFDDSNWFCSLKR
ncbi:MAG TPA: tRNA(Ile)(2)-agmatinylcytidine synthase [Candidatus Nitrosotalea sp.]|nr:tRNA(Ile)(2)-agmatinylcytidine synthase [Candidatus Nitrosotalea sp.]